MCVWGGGGGQCLSWEELLDLVSQRRSIRLILTGFSGTIRNFWYISSGLW